MKKRQKMATQRICVTLPTEMLENFRMRAEVCGISVSRVIFLTLRSKNRNVLLLPSMYVESVKQMNRLIEKALAENAVTPELTRLLEDVRREAQRAGALVHGEEGKK